MASQTSALSVRPHAPRRRQHTAHIRPYLGRAARPWAGGGIGFGGDDQQADGDVSGEAMAAAGSLGHVGLGLEAPRMSLDLLNN